MNPHGMPVQSRMDLRDKINHGFFDVKFPYPTKPNKPLIPKNATAALLTDLAHQMFVYEEEYEKYKTQVTLWRKESNDLHEKFKLEAFEYCGIEGHPKRERAFEMARRNNMAYSEILDELLDLSEIMVK